MDNGQWTLWGGRSTPQRGTRNVRARGVENPTIEKTVENCKQFTTAFTTVWVYHNGDATYNPRRTLKGTPATILVIFQ